MKIIKRDERLEDFNAQKIRNAVQKAFESTQNSILDEHMEEICRSVEKRVHEEELHGRLCSVEDIQDQVEEILMKLQYFKEAKSYILYRQKRQKIREERRMIQNLIPDERIVLLLDKIEKEFDEVSFQPLFLKYQSYYDEGLDTIRCLDILMRCCVELISVEAPQWEKIAARFLNLKLHLLVDEQCERHHLMSFYDKLCFLEKEGYYGSYILENYSKEEIDELESCLKEENDDLFTYSGLDLLYKRYLISSHAHELLETPQEMFMGIAMHLAMAEKEKRLFWAKQFYELLSSLKVTMATPTMANARKPFHQLSSCFIDTVDDSLDGIYKSLDNFAKVSKHGGGMGLYFGKVRANGSDIRGFQGAAGGVIRWIKLVNDTATAVDQLGVRSGAVAVYLDAWHKDLPEFLALRTNNGDDRQKAHDVFPAVCYPNLFWKMVEEDISQTWYLMDPHEIEKVKGYCLEDFYGEEWERRYESCVADSRISKRAIVLRDLVRLIIKSAVETGTPFTFNRDIVNEANPNAHKGMIYCSNLCTEIAQNMSALSHRSQKIVEVDGEKIIVDEYVPGDFVVCNLASLTLGKINVNDERELKQIISLTVRALDNVIDLNYYPLPFARITNQQYRPIGLGTSGYHHMLALQGIAFESEDHLQFVDQLYEKINYYAIEASCALAKEKGCYDFFEGSDWDTGAYFEKRGYTDEKWQKLKEKVHQDGLRNAYLLAIAPTSSTSIISATTAAVDPIMNRYFLEEKKGSIITRIAPDLNPKTFWLYKQAHQIDQTWLVKAAGVRQRHIDQSQSVNLYITNEFTMRQVLNLYLLAYHEKVKTLYYVRSRSLEVEECESCAS
ncbi:ribonucleoside-diphosphate reductase subunit alpha [uncultured Traorella sp.]|uniref:ribonucleoside-diphosphate reductase subunit alpha n=1 Tax=uncultured Traorella sp. TaxID=1929048 RepID=UPI0025F1A28C|nr:ribonucleoside-diphosphate reductase subunit alpha [uncultured Traorella sp.]